MEERRLSRTAEKLHRRKCQEVKNWLPNLWGVRTWLPVGRIRINNTLSGGKRRFWVLGVFCEARITLQAMYVPCTWIVERILINGSGAAGALAGELDAGRALADQLDAGRALADELDADQASARVVEGVITYAPPFAIVVSPMFTAATNCPPGSVANHP
jgi:hypothetical protein